MEIDTTSNMNGAPAPRPGSTDALVDAAFDAMNDLGTPPKKRAPEAGEGADAEEVAPKRQARRADPEREEGEDEALPGAEGEEEEHEAQDAEDEGAEEEEHDTRGSKEEPFTVKDLPKDKYIELKVDGERVTVSFDELASGYIREETFSRRINKTKALAEQAEEMVAKATGERQRVREELRALLHDPEQLYDFFLASDDREQVLEAVARKYAELRRLHRERPEERLRFQRQRDQERLEYERRAWQQQVEAEKQERIRKEQTERARSIFQPGWEAGLRRAGFPEVTQGLWDEVMVRVNQKHQRGEQVTSDDVTDFVVRAAKLLELAPRGGKKRPAPAPVKEPRREAAPAGRRKGDPWAGKTRAQKLRDPDYFLKNLRMRDYR